MSEHDSTTQILYELIGILGGVGILSIEEFASFENRIVELCPRLIKKEEKQKHGKART